MKTKSTRKMSETELVFFFLIFYIHFRSLTLSLHIFAFVLSADGVGVRGTVGEVLTCHHRKSSHQQQFVLCVYIYME